LVIYCIYIRCVNLVNMIKQLWKRNTNKNEKMWFVRSYRVPLSPGSKIVFAILILMVIFTIGWNMTILSHIAGGISKLRNPQLASEIDSKDIAQSRQLVRRMFKTNIIQTVMVLGDFTPLSYLAISSLLSSSISSSKSIVKYEQRDDIYPYVFVGSSSRIYEEKENNSEKHVFHTHFGLSLGDHFGDNEEDDMLYQWIHAILSTALWSTPRFNLTQVIKEYEQSPENVKPMIFIDFDVLSGLCIQPIRDTLQIAPGTKLFGIITPENDDRLKFALNRMYGGSPRCICLSDQCEASSQGSMRNESILFGGSKCIMDNNAISNAFRKEMDIQKMCISDNKEKDGDVIYEKCCALNSNDGCYMASNAREQNNDMCEWRKHTIALSRQRRLFTHLANAFPAEDMFIMDILSYLDNPLPLEKEFAEFLSLPFGIDGKVQGTYTDKNPRICIKEMMRSISKHKIVDIDLS